MSKSIKKAMAGVAALAALALGGSAIAGAASSSSSTSTTGTAPPGTTAAPPSQSGSGAPARPAFNGPAPGTAAHEEAEKPVTGGAAEKARAAAVKSVGGGTAGAVTTDYSKTGYETTVTKSDGTKVEIHLDSSFNVMQRPGPGGSGAPGAPGAQPPA